MASDSFAPAPPPPASEVRTVTIILTVTEAVVGPPAVARQYAARYSFDQLSATGTIVDVRHGNLVPHLSPAQLTQAKAFLDAMLAKAQSSVG